MKRKFIKLLIIGTLILSFVGGCVVTNKITGYRNQQTQMSQQQDTNVLLQQSITSQLNREFKLNCYSGKQTVPAVKSNRSDNWFNNMIGEKTMNVKATYDFNFEYDLKDLPVKVTETSILIKLDINRLTLNKCELSDISTSEKTGLFGSFSPEEVNEINQEIQSGAKKYVESNAQLRNEAMNNVKKNIVDLVSKLNCNKNVQFVNPGYEFQQTKTVLSNNVKGIDIKQDFIKLNQSPRKEAPKYIIIHCTGNKNDTAQGNRDYFSRANRNSSADVFVDDNEAIQIIDSDKYYSWAVGDGQGIYGITNSNSISIEMCGTDDGNISEKTIQNTISVTEQLCRKYNINKAHVLRHYDASRKECPKPFMVNNWERWREFKFDLKNIPTSRYFNTVSRI